jgi:hypothetical protein
VLYTIPKDHPHIDQSVVNKRWVEELEKHPDQFTVHQIYQAYPDGLSRKPNHKSQLHQSIVSKAVDS